ncbi:hypothetical protein [Pseudoroseicyclus sp. CXY001]|uniref:hypothetical protein n=1 Tax=Pseudoroseicyclus sp. CXY001 TaxID=3242492 RepID=UPI003570BC4B
MTERVRPFVIEDAAAFDRAVVSTVLAWLMLERMHSDAAGLVMDRLVWLADNEAVRNGAPPYHVAAALRLAREGKAGLRALHTAGALAKFFSERSEDQLRALGWPGEGG